MDTPEKFWYRNVRCSCNGIASDAGRVIVKAKTGYEAHNKLVQLQAQWDLETGEMLHIVGHVKELSLKEIQEIEASLPSPIYLSALR